MLMYAQSEYLERHRGLGTCVPHMGGIGLSWNSIEQRSLSLHNASVASGARVL